MGTDELIRQPDIISGGQLARNTPIDTKLLISGDQPIFAHLIPYNGKYFYPTLNYYCYIKKIFL